MQYTRIDKETVTERDNVCQPGNKIDLQRARKDIPYFAYHLLGIKPYAYQYMIFKTFEKGCKRIVICQSRQTGKTTGLGIICLHSAFYNTMSSGIHNNTKICIISKSEDQAKKVMDEIKRMISIGDYKMQQRTKMYINSEYYKPAYFSSKIDKNAANNTTQISFVDGSYIKSFSPTDACRGESADILIIDEAAYVDEETYKNAMCPTVAFTRGIIIMSSTPRGQKGFFYKIFDPFDVMGNHEFTRFWFNWRQCESEDMKEDIKKKMKRADVEGDMKNFQQEYDALFTVDSEAFFDSDLVDNGIDKSLEFLYESNLPACVGVDFGMSRCHSVMSIVVKDGEYFKLIQQIKYPLETPDTVIYNDLQDVDKRFKVMKFVLDDCAQAYRTITDLEAEGKPVVRYNFRSAQADRNKGYYLFKSMLNKGFIKYPYNEELLVEMKGLICEDLSINQYIGKSKGGYDDRCDSFMMACYPFLKQDDKPMLSYVAGDDLMNMTEHNYKTGEDQTWKNITEMSKPLMERLPHLNNPLGAYLTQGGGNKRK